jgi:glycosyltransferase involved in cell wall biosynthesis
MLARSGAPGDLADALEPLLTSPRLRGEIGEAGRARFACEFTDAAMCKRFVDHLNRLIAGKQHVVERDPLAPALGAEHRA